MDKGVQRYGAEVSLLLVAIMGLLIVYLLGEIVVSLWRQRQRDKAARQRRTP